MFKNLISPIQAWLLSQGRCVGCGDNLSRGAVKDVRSKTTVTCRCGRIFIHDSKKNIYRRALFDEI
jgi:predicted  nucleic acid-binding Zn-ribbon protein